MVVTDALAHRERFVDDASGEALTEPRVLTSTERAEAAWARANPEGRSSLDGPGLRLWNFDVGRATVKLEHISPLRSFLAPWTLSEPPVDIGISVTGSASRTGSERANEALSSDRAAAVARLLHETGFRRVEARGHGAVPTGPDDPVSLARHRGVLVEVPQAPQVPEPPPQLPPTWPVTPGPAPAGAFPSAEMRIAIDSPPLPVSIPPSAPLLEGTVRLNGEVFIRGGDPEALERLTVIYNRAEGRLSAQFSQIIADGISAKLQVDPPSPGAEGEAAFRISADFRNLPLTPEIGFQSSQDFIYITLTLLEAPWSVELFGGTILLVARLRVRFDLRPSLLLVSRAAPYAARTVAVIAETAVAAAPAAVAIGTVGVILAWTAGVALSVGWAREASERRAQLVTARVAFAAPIAAATVGAAAQPQLASLLTELRQLRPQAVGEVAGTYAARAVAQLQALSPSERQARIDAWQSNYGVASNGSPDLEFNAVRERMTIRLGGVSADGPSEFIITDL